jgi:NAD(P)-dependent dehydrogenase (short-subunit alcohol dehydrogenase family)
MEIIRRPRTRTGVRIATQAIEMKVGLVIGVSSGIGEAVAERLTAKGMENLKRIGRAHPPPRPQWDAVAATLGAAASAASAP